jgi:hypothetical protein
MSGHARFCVRALSADPNLREDWSVGYDLHITKAVDWVEAEEFPIDRQTWLSLAVGSPTLVQAGKVSFVDGPSGEDVDYPLFALLNAEGPSLYWRRGEVVVSGATEDHISDLVRLADHLQAQLVGDNGEVYE